MITVRTTAELRATVGAKKAGGARVGLVPTMGALHEGHLSLIRAAVAGCDLVVVSVFVNPAQFRPGEDLDAYPRDLDSDLGLAAEAGADVVYAPDVADVYPEGYATEVRVRGGLTDVLCGAPGARGPEHFDGVTTVVAKLFNKVAPDVAYFGQKDAQQAIVIRRMAADLDFPVQIEVMPTVRGSDGLALSSRNAYLSDDERRRAPALSRALAIAREQIEAGEADAAKVLAAARAELERAGIEPEYLEARDAGDLSPLHSFNGKPVLVAVAAPVGTARLIDNVIVEPPGSTPGATTR